VLVTQGGLFHIAGSEVATYEISQYFAQSGAEVAVVSYGFSDAWKARFESDDAVSIYRLDDPEVDRWIRTRPPELAWIHHQVIPEALVREPGSANFVFHHMSTFLKQEFPLSPRIEAALASAVVFPAQEALDAQRASGLLRDVPPDRLRVLGNPAPDRFYCADRSHSADLRSILVVSNHAPEEVIEAMTLISPETRLVHVGDQAGNTDSQRLLAPDDLLRADAVLTIGKTVQYAILSRTPVYCYDHFGGPGWLTESNFQAARVANFSGRGFGTKSSQAIADELVGGYAAACNDADKVADRFAEEFTLSSVMDRLFNGLPDRPLGELDEQEVAAFLARQEVSSGMTNALEARIQTVEYLTTLNRLLEVSKVEAASRLNEVESSKWYRSVKRFVDWLPGRG
jgi:hypothetical protein